MNADDLDRIRADLAALEGRLDHVAGEFYEALFELAPSVRSLFPSDLSAQREKFIVELDALVDLAVAADSDAVELFAARANDLGRRHVAYGVTPAHYDVVGAALLAALELHVTGWDDEHRRSWGRMYRLVVTAMLEDGSVGVQAGHD